MDSEGPDQTAQSDQDPHCTLTEYLDTAAHIDVYQTSL